jgi:hypothetical protein
VPAACRCGSGWCTAPAEHAVRYNILLGQTLQLCTLQHVAIMFDRSNAGRFTSHKLGNGGLCKAKLCPSSCPCQCAREAVAPTAVPLPQHPRLHSGLSPPPRCVCTRTWPPPGACPAQGSCMWMSHVCSSSIAQPVTDSVSLESSLIDNH